MVAMALGLIAKTARFLYDGFVFSVEWCVFIVLLMSLYNVVTLVLNRVKEAIVLWVVIFIAHVLIRFFFVYTDPDPNSPGVVLHSPRFFYDAFMFSVEWAIFLVIILAIYNLIFLVTAHIHYAIIMWVILFIVHVVFQIVFAHSHDYYDW